MNNHTNIEPVNNDLNLVKYEKIDIKNLIYCIRGKQVMLDSDVAMLYHYQTKMRFKKIFKKLLHYFSKTCIINLTITYYS